MAIVLLAVVVIGGVLALVLLSVSMMACTLLRPFFSP